MIFLLEILVVEEVRVCGVGLFFFFFPFFDFFFFFFLFERSPLLTFVSTRSVQYWLDS